MTPQQILNAASANDVLSALLVAGDAAGLLAALNAKNIERSDSTLYGPAGLAKKLAPEIVEAAALSFEAAAQSSATMRLLLQTFSTYGFDFSDDLTRAQIDAMVLGGMPQPVGDALKAIGRWNVSIADGFGGDATLENVQQAIALKQRETLYAEVAQRYNLTVAAMDAGSVTTLAEAKTFFAG